MEVTTDTPLVISVLLPLALAAIMFTLGLALEPADFRRVVSLPRGVLIGLANLLVLSPFLAFGVAEVLGLDAAFAVGLVLLGASPGGTLANLLTHLARGETALSITMTAVSSIAAVITIPLYLTLAIDHFGAAGFNDDISAIAIAVRVLLITIVPLSIGMYVGGRDPEWAARNEPRLKAVAVVAFVFVVAAAVSTEFDTIADNFTEVAIATLLLNVLAMGLSFTIARAARLGDRQATAIAMELGIHNGTVAIAVATTIDPILAAPAAVYSMFMFITAGTFARIMSRRNEPR